MSSGSGAKVANECVDQYNDLKLKRTYKYITFKMSDDKKEIIVDKAIKPSGCTGQELHEEFLKELPETGCRYAVYDFEYELPEGEGTRNKICFLSWTSDDAKVKEKMVYSSSKDALRRALVGIAVEMQGTDYSEVSYQSFYDKANKK